MDTDAVTYEIIETNKTEQAYVGGFVRILLLTHY